MNIKRISRVLSGLIVFLSLTTSVSFAQTEPKVVAIPFYDAWLNSPHGNFRSNAFTNWNEAGEVPVRCATCHSTSGYLDFLGADGSTRSVVDHPAPVEEGVQCTACHNRMASSVVDITFPSGLVVPRRENDAMCMYCHQGRSSGNTVNSAIARAGVAVNESSSELSFINIHYSPAAATRFGVEAGGGYEYEGRAYAGLHYHGDFATQCNDCHNSHTTQVRVSACADCHKVTTADDLAFIRETKIDFNGNGNIEEGMKYEISGLHDILYQALLDYSREVTGTQLVYSSTSFPYFFADLNANGVRDEGEGNFSLWTPRLLKAAYNYQFVAKDKAAYAHNAYYVLQLLHDSIEDLGQEVTVPSITRFD